MGAHRTCMGEPPVSAPAGHRQPLEGSLMPAENLLPSERSLRARIAAHSRWAQEDRVAGTQAARAAFLARFEREVDPERVLSNTERSRRAESAKKAYFTRLALRSARARSARARTERP